MREREIVGVCVEWINLFSLLIVLEFIVCMARLGYKNSQYLFVSYNISSICISMYCVHIGWCFCLNVCFVYVFNHGMILCSNFCLIITLYETQLLLPNWKEKNEKQETKKRDLKPYAILSDGEHSKCVLICMHIKYTVCVRQCDIHLMKTITLKYIVHNKFMANLISFYQS